MQVSLGNEIFWQMSQSLTCVPKDFSSPNDTCIGKIKSKNVRILGYLYRSFNLE